MGRHFCKRTRERPPVGYALDTTLGYLEPNATNGGVILYRYTNTTNGNYLLDTSPVAPSGYGAGVNLGYIRVVGAPPTGIVTTYTRNALGQVLQASNPNVTYTYT